MFCFLLSNLTGALFTFASIFLVSVFLWFSVFLTKIGLTAGVAGFLYLFSKTKFYSPCTMSERLKRVSMEGSIIFIGGILLFNIYERGIMVDRVAFLWNERNNVN
jgi:hypothetical protein